MRAVWNVIAGAIAEFSHDNVPRLGASLAFYTAFSIAPVLVIAVALASLAFGPEAARGELSSQLQMLLGPEGARFVEATVERASHRGGGGLAALISGVVLLFGASAAFVELQSAMNAVWDVPPETDWTWRDLVQKRLLSFGMVLVMGFLLLVSLVLSAAIAAIGTWASSWWPMPGWAMQGLNAGLGFVLATVLFAFMFKVLPDCRIAWADVLPGAAITSILFAVGKLLIGLYLGQSTVASMYGAAGSLAVLLLWVYFSAQIVLLGAEITQVYARQRGSHRERPEAEARAADWDQLWTW